MNEDDRKKYLEELMQPHIPLRVLQEIRQDLSEYNIYDHEQVFTDYYDAFNTGIHTALIIIDKHIKEIEEC